LAYTHHGEVASISGDGIMCRFQRPEDAAALAMQVLESLHTFNKKQNHLMQPMALRLGVHTGEVLENESMSQGQIISKTVDTAAKLQQRAQPNHAQFSEATVALLGDKGKTFPRKGWNAELGTNVFDYAAEGEQAGTALRPLPEPARALIVEPEPGEFAKLKKALLVPVMTPLRSSTKTRRNLAIESWTPHVIFVSLDLPWKTGWDLLSRIRANSVLSQVPIVAMSHQTTGETVQKSFQVGANGFLRKPLDEQQILKRTEMVLREFYL